MWSKIEKDWDLSRERSHVIQAQMVSRFQCYPDSNGIQAQMLSKIEKDWEQFNVIQALTRPPSSPLNLLITIYTSLLSSHSHHFLNSIMMMVIICIKRWRWTSPSNDADAAVWGAVQLPRGSAHLQLWLHHQCLTHCLPGLISIYHIYNMNMNITKSTYQKQIWPCWAFLSLSLATPQSWLS